MNSPKNSQVKPSTNQTQSKSFIGAGVLFYDLDSETKEPMFLLGKEFRPYEGGKKRHGTYSDFGGHADEGEDPKATAVRELTEESMGHLSINLPEGMPIESYCFRNYPKSYYIFIHKVKKQDTLKSVENFNAQFKHAEENDLLPKEPNGLFEKSEMKWFTLKEIIASKDNIRQPFYTNLLHIVKARFT